jgi:hypothetical protein
MRTDVRTILAVSVALIATACESRTDPQPDAGGAVPCNYMGTLYDDGAVFAAADGCNTCKCNPGGTPGRWGCSLKACQTDAGSDAAGAGFPTFCQGPGGQASHGSTLSQDDSCCACSAPGTSPPQLQCAPKVTTVKCNYNGTLYDDGAVFPAGDGCNSCKCNPTGCMPGKWGCSLVGCGGQDGGGVPADAPVPDAPGDRRRPDDGPPPDFLRPEHPGGSCPIDPPTPGTSCNLEPNQGCSYRPICESGTPVDQYCSCPSGRWACHDGGYCARE